MKNSQIKSKQRVKDHAEVFTNPREVKAMCDLIPQETYANIDSKFLEPACGEGAFLIEILKRKFAYCTSGKDGLKAINSVYGVDIQADNVAITRLNIVELFKQYFPKANDFALTVALAITNNNIICDDFLNPHTESVKKWHREAKMGQLSLFD